MNFLLDTNVISEPMKPRPNAGVLAWLAEVDEDSVFLSVVTITELRYCPSSIPGERYSCSRRSTRFWPGNSARKPRKTPGLWSWEGIYAKCGRGSIGGGEGGEK